MESGDSKIETDARKESKPARKCIICTNSIPENALKCTECGTFQNWRRHLPFITIAISILLGAASVFSTAYPVIKDMLKKDFEVEVEEVGVNAEYYTVLVRNTGKQPIVIKYINIFFGEDLAFLEIEGGDGVVAENSVRILRLRLPDDFERPTREESIDFSRREFSSDEVVQRCEIMLSIIGSGNEEWFTVKGESCFDMADFLSGIQSVG